MLSEGDLTRGVPQTGAQQGRGAGEEEREHHTDHEQGFCTCLFDEVHEAGPEAPGLVAVALQGADGELGGPLGGHGHHVHGVVHQRCVRLRKHRAGLGPAGLLLLPAPSLRCSRGTRTPGLAGEPRGGAKATSHINFRVFSALAGTLHRVATGRGRSGGPRQAGEGF